MRKQGAELSINIIIVAILGLLVLVVLAFVFKGQIGKSANAYDIISKNTNACIENPNAQGCNDYLTPKPSQSSGFSPKLSSHTSILSSIFNIAWSK